MNAETEALIVAAWHRHLAAQIDQSDASIERALKAARAEVLGETAERKSEAAA